MDGPNMDFSFAMYGSPSWLYLFHILICSPM